MQDIRPCPFCGSTRLKLARIPDLANVRCLDCGASTGNKPSGTDAVRAWNRRKEQR